MAVIKTLKENGRKIYPITSSECVFTPEGKTVDALITEKVRELPERIGKVEDDVVELGHEVDNVEESLETLGSKLFGEEGEQIDLSKYEKTAGVIDVQTSTYVGTAPNYQHVNVPILSGKFISVKAPSSRAATFAFCKSVGVRGDALDLCAGTNVYYINTGGSIEDVETPEDSVFLVVNVVSGGSDISPIITLRGDSGIINKIQDDSKRSVFRLPKEVWHGFVELENAIVPSQSIFDIHFAKRLGYTFIEANTHKCADGVFMIKHGNNDGSLGIGLKFAEGSPISSSTKWDNVTSSQIKEYASYQSNDPRFDGGKIPTLDEFCAECASIDMGVLLQSPSHEELNIARKYLDDTNIIAYALNERGDFRGFITTWKSASSLKDALKYVEALGFPTIFSWSDYSSASEELRYTITKGLHSKGYFISSSYLSGDSYWKSKKNLDQIVVTGYECIPFDYGNYLNIIQTSDKVVFNRGSSYDASSRKYIMPSNSRLLCPDEFFKTTTSKTCVRVCFKGKIRVMAGYSANTTIESQDYSFVEIAGVSGVGRSGSSLFEIDALEDSEITSLLVHVSII